MARTRRNPSASQREEAANLLRHWSSVALLTRVGEGREAVYPRPLDESGRAMADREMERALVSLATEDHADGAAWVLPFLRAGAHAYCETAAVLAETDKTRSLGTNVLAAVGNAISDAVQRRLLLEALQGFDWQLTRVSEVLHMGGAGNVTKAIVRLGLEKELSKARGLGKALQGRRPRNRP